MQNNSQQNNFIDRLEHALIDEIDQYITKKLDPETLREIRDSIYYTLSAMLFAEGHLLNESALCWLCNQYFKSIQIDGTSVDKLVVINDYNLEELEYQDIDLIYCLYKNELDSPIQKQVLEEFNFRKKKLS